MGGDTSMSIRQLDQTPTWAVTGVSAVIIVISVTLENVLRKFGKYLTEKHKKALFQALEKVKAELMVLGFISLILTFSQRYIAKICISDRVADTMLPCAKRHQHVKEGSHRSLLGYEHHRLLSDVSTSTCNKGKVPLITVDGLHELHILIFFLAIFHVLFTATTGFLARLKTRDWKHWEAETLSPEYQFSHDARLTHEDSFIKNHTSFWIQHPFFFYTGCFFRQFFWSIRRSDYLTLRNAFISRHLAPGSQFNFQKYIKRSLMDDFQVVVGISPVLWASFLIFCLLNVNGWRMMFWASLIPLVITLAIGTELQVILTKMALDPSERNRVQSIPLVLASDKYFLFLKPHLMLHLIHFVLFQNAFQITYFLWIWYEYNIDSCFHDNKTFVILRLVIGIGVFILCSYITLPLYALLSQMGSNMKKSIFDEQTSKALMQWRMSVRKKLGDKSSKSLNRELGDRLGTSISPHSSPLTLPRSKTTGYTERSVTKFGAEQPSRFKPPNTQQVIDVNVDDQHETEIQNADGFSVKSMPPSP
ncbi:MLO-like protein 10 [Rutidosis leptorrhynchoides]|uniref:MLO-like protein 10 n=1 Tax=Rutidosis leptorrhynchoides TaxID=125765 RepID=UPI003A9967BD